MFFDSTNFRTLESGAMASWMQQQIHMQNLSNIETPNYKAKSMVFDELLERNRESQQTERLYRTRVVTDEGTESRIDGNNVQSDKESIELYKAYAQYSVLLDKIKGQFTQYNAVLNSGLK